MKKWKKYAAMLMAFCFLFGMTVQAATGDQTGTTENQPFVNGVTGKSANFRIPSLVTTTDGLLAATDARWNTTGDGGGLDTIVARSVDEGANWSWSFANYLGDNGDAHSYDSTAFIDPVMAADGNTVYMLVDLFPGGYALNSAASQPVAGNGYDEQGRLILKKGTETGYDYYLENGVIYLKSTVEGVADEAVTEYTVDDKFNLVSEGEIVSNLFYKNAPYSVYPTTYLYMTKSTDGGATWQAPQLLLQNTKKAEERFYGVGPGRGLVIDRGEKGKRILFPCYQNGNGAERASFIYSDDDGNTWTRTADLSGLSSEVAVTQVGETLYAFARTSSSNMGYVSYYVSDNYGETWSQEKTNSQINIYTACQMSAITYSEKIDGYPAILLSCPTGTSRGAGKIFVGLVKEDQSIEWRYSKQITSGSYAYSCLTETNTGKIALLYENGGGTEAFATYTIEEIAPAAVTGDVPIVNNTYVRTNEIQSGKQYLIINNQGRILTPTATTLSGKQVTGLLNISVENLQEYLVGNYDRNLWTITGDATSGYAIAASDGTYLGIGNANGGEHTILTEAQNNTVWTIEISDVGYTIKSGATYLDTYTDGFTAGWDQTGSVNENEEFYFYEVEIQADPVMYINGTIVEATRDVELMSAPEIKLTGRIASDWQSSDPTVAQIRSNGKGDFFVYGLKEGTATITALDSNGEVILQREVQIVPIHVDVQLTVDETISYVFQDLNFSGYEDDIVKVSYDNSGFITLTGKKIGETSTSYGPFFMHIFVTDPNYKITNNASGSTYGQGEELKHLITTEGKVTATGYTGDGVASVEYESSDNTVATVDQDGNITGGKPGKAKIKAILKDAYGDVITEKYVFVEVLNIKPLSEDTTVTTRSVELYVGEIVDSHLYYHQNNEMDYKEVFEGTLIHLDTEEAWVMTFFSAPLDDMYALSLMTAANNLGTSNWYGMADPTDQQRADNDYTYTDLYTYKGTLSGFYSNEEINQMIGGAKNLTFPCDGGFWFTRSTENSQTCKAYIRAVSEKLPQLEKRVRAIITNGVVQPYDETADMHVNIGDTIVYELQINEKAAYNYGGDGGAAEYAFTFLNQTIADELTDNSIYRQYDPTTGTLSDPIAYSGDMDLGISSVNVDTTLSFYTALQLTRANYGRVVQDGAIYNEATLGYDYSSKYSSATMTQGSEASALIKVKNDTYVVDFGLPLHIDQSSELGAADVITGVTSKYGDVVIDGDGKGFTYTPNQVLPSYDYLIIQVNNDATYGAFVLPATTVYYEDGFATGFTGGSNRSKTQTTSLLAKNEIAANPAVYGYDSAYDDPALENTYAVSNVKGEKASFTFTGTGVDIYMGTSQSTGYITIQILQNNVPKQIAIVDTSMKNGENTLTQGQDCEGVNIPVYTKTDLPYGTYIVNIYHSMNDSEVKLDGFRVYNTYKDSSAYEPDREANPIFCEMRDMVLTQFVTDKQMPASKMAEQIYQSLEKEGVGAWILRNNENFTEEEITDLIKNGPKNELYLYPGDTLSFKAPAEALQIGMKGLNARTSIATSAISNMNIDHTTDMFRTITPNEQGVYSITNNSGQILSLTKLKLFEENAVALTKMTRDDIMSILEMHYSRAASNPNKADKETTKPSNDSVEDQETQSANETANETANKSVSEAVKTGDQTNIIGYLAAILVSFTLIGFVLVKKRKKDR